MMPLARHLVSVYGTGGGPEQNVDVLHEECVTAQVGFGNDPAGLQKCTRVTILFRTPLEAASNFLASAFEAVKPRLAELPTREGARGVCGATLNDQPSVPKSDFNTRTKAP
jgi:hypothetical protein